MVLISVVNPEYVPHVKRKKIRVVTALDLIQVIWTLQGICLHRQKSQFFLIMIINYI